MLSKSRGWLVDQLGDSKKSRTSRRRDKSPSHPWLARPTPAIMCLHAIGPMPISHQPISPSSPTDFDRPWQGARGAADRGQGEVNAPLAPAGPRRADTRTGWLRDTVPSRRVHSPWSSSKAPERGCPIPRAICPDRTWRGPPGSFNPGQLSFRLPPKTCPGLLCPRSGAGVRLTGSCQEQHPPSDVVLTSAQKGRPPRR